VYFNFQEQNASNAERMEEFKRVFKPGRLLIKSYSPRSLSAFQIKSFLEKLRTQNTAIDCVLVDYLTLMRPNTLHKEDNMYTKGKEITEELKALAMDENLLVFTALQVKAGAYGHQNQGIDQVSESLAIGQLLDSLINMTEMITDDINPTKYLIFSCNKVRDNERTNKRIYMELKKDLSFVTVKEQEKILMIEEYLGLKSQKKAKNFMAMKEQKFKGLM